MEYESITNLAIECLEEGEPRLTRDLVIKSPL